MKRAKSIEVFSLRNPKKWRSSHFLFALAAVYCIFVTFRFRHLISIGGDGGGGGLDRPQFSLAYHETMNRKLSSDLGQDLTRKPVDDPLATRARISYGRITGEIMRRQNRKFSWSGNLTVLDALARDAWNLGAKAWEELESFRDSGNLELEHLLDGKRMEPCPTSVSLDAKKTKKFGLSLGLEMEEVMFLPCGLEMGSSITVIGRPEIAHREHVPELVSSGRGDGSVMVSQFMMELQGLKAVDGEDPLKILHFNPRLKGDWSKRPVIELNTCYRMQWGKSLRCDGVSSEGDDTVDGFNKCEKWERSDTAEMKDSRTTLWLNRFIGRAKKPEMTWPFPFVVGKLFVLTLQAGIEGYHIYIGGRHVTSFPYRPGSRKAVNSLLKKEAEYFGDIVVLPFIDQYELVVLKTIAICEYGVHNVSAAYIMKCDDDTFVRLDVVLREISNVANEKSLYMGNLNLMHRPLRTGKWAVTYEEWPEEVYPPYANGPGYIISNDIASFVSSKHANQSLRIFKMEDVSMGMWVEEFNASSGVRYSHSWRFCQYGCTENYYTAHYQSSRQMICLWDKLSRGQAQCCNY